MFISTFDLLKFSCLLHSAIIHSTSNSVVISCNRQLSNSVVKLSVVISWKPPIQILQCPTSPVQPHLPNLTCPTSPTQLDTVAANSWIQLPAVGSPVGSPTLPYFSINAGLEFGLENDDGITVESKCIFV